MPVRGRFFFQGDMYIGALVRDLCSHFHIPLTSSFVVAAPFDYLFVVLRLDLPELDGERLGRAVEEGWR